MKPKFYLLLILPFFFNSCSQNEKRAIVGKWEKNSTSITVKTDNSSIREEITKKVTRELSIAELISFDENNKFITSSLEEQGSAYMGSYSLENGKLVLTVTQTREDDNGKKTLIKQELLNADAEIINKGKSLKLKTTITKTYYKNKYNNYGEYGEYEEYGDKQNKIDAIIEILLDRK